MMRVFTCAECGVAVSRPVTSGGPGTPASDGAPFVPEGRFAVVANQYGPEHEGFFALHLSDALHTRELEERSQGCCGKDGLDGLNTLCANGDEIGTEKSDCWMSHALLLDPARVKA